MHDTDWGQRAARWQGIRTEWVQVQGTAVRTLRHDGPGGDAAGTPIVLVHGLGGAATNWLDVIAGLASKAPVLAMDLPGFGESEPPRDTAPRVRVQARFLPALLAAVGWDRVRLFGNSMGGMVVTLTAGAHPDLIERLVLVNPGLPAPIGAALRVPLPAVVTFAPFALGLGERILRWRGSRRSPEELFHTTMGLCLGEAGGCSPELEAVGIEAARRGRELPWRAPSFATAAESLLALLIGPGRTRMHRAIDAIEAPTLVLWGDADRIVGRAVIDGVAARRPDWSVHVWEGVGHVPMIEVPDPFLDVVCGWLDLPAPTTSAAA